MYRYPSASLLQTVFTAPLMVLVVLAMCAVSPVSTADSQSTGPGETALDSAGSIDVFEALTVIDIDELAGMRGGFEVAGLQIDIGAYIRTFLDGIQVLESVVNLTASDGVSAGGLAVVNSVLNAIEFQGLQVVDSRTGGLAGLRDQIPDRVDLGALNDANGVILNDSKGFTAALLQVDRSRIVSAIVNTANGRLIRQEVDVIVDIANFRQFQQAARDALRAGALSRAGRLK